MTDPFESSVALGLKEISRRGGLLVGVSGGRDSMALLHALTALGCKKLTVCHLDHGLRGRAARADARFVLRAARAMGHGVESARARTRDFASATGQSLETSARELRIAFFEECARRRGCRRLLLAHHADDQIETCLFRFLRGSGASGLAGMRPVTQLRSLKIIRPFLGVARAEIDAYVRREKIAYREDASNADTMAARNALRHVVIPAIEKHFGGAFRRAIPRAAGILREEDEWLESQLPAFSPRLSCAALRAMAPAIRSRVVLRWLRRGRVPEPGHAETHRVLSLLDVVDGPAKISLPGHNHARRRQGEIFLGREEVS